jgi:uncharacterized membrane protein
MKDKQLETLVGQLLRFGVTLAALLVSVGLVRYLFGQGGDSASYHVFQGEPSEFRSVGGILTSAFGWSRRGLIQLGILVLIATPVARVLLSLAVFTKQRDRVYVLITSIVLAVLAFSLLSGK